MNKNFVTKYQSSVTNDDLPRLGKVIVRLQKNGSSKSIRVRMFANKKLTVEGNASIITANNPTWDGKSLTANPDSSSGTNYEFTLDDNDGKILLPKYSLWGLWINCQQGESIDISELDYAEAINFLNISSNTTIRDTRAIGNIRSLSKCKELSSLSLNNVDISGNLSDIKDCPLSSLSLMDVDISGNLSDIKDCPLSSLALNNVDISGDIVNLNGKDLTYLRSTLPNLSGDISILSSMKNLKTCELYYGNYSGNLSSVSALTNLKSLALPGTSVTGNLSSVSALTNLTQLNLANTQVSGNVDNLAGLTKLASLTVFGNLSLTGDMSKIPANVKLISQAGRKITTNFTWTAGGRQNAKLLAMEGAVPFDTASMDNMLIDQATCTFEPNGSQPWTKTIAVSGTRTAASDAAVATLQSKGVTITGVTKQA